MSPGCRVSVLSLSLLACFLQVLSQGAVFGGRRRASSVFLRSKRANSFLVEELLQGNLERECYEELCSYEEAREYFEDSAKTMTFWTVYYDGDQCVPNPCLHDGNCTDKLGGFHCSCSPPHYGTLCELGAPGPQEGPPTAPQFIVPEPSECPTEGPEACHQFCLVSADSFSCSCMEGFELQTDGQSCLPAGEFPCGRVSSLFDDPMVTGPICRHGNCPWQVSLVDGEGAELCGGAVLGRRSVLTAASCLFLNANLQLSSLRVVAGPRASAVVLPVQSLYIHSRFRRDHHDNDLVLLQLAKPLPFGPALFHACLPIKDFSENVLMRSGRAGLVGGQPDGRTTPGLRGPVYVTLDECRSQLNVSHLINNKMFCMRSQNGGQGSHSDPPGRTGGRSRRQAERHDSTWAQTGTVNQNGSLGSTNGASGSPNDQKNQNGQQGSQNGTQSQIGALKSQDGDQAAVSKNRLETQNGRQKSSGSEVGGRQGGLLLGTAVATEHKGTVFLTGLLISSHPASGERGLVFTKLSRHLAWLRQRLEISEDHMNLQVRQYPDERHV